MKASELGGSPVNIVFTFAKIEIDDVYRNNLYDFIVSVALTDMLTYCFRSCIEYSLEKIAVGIKLDFYYYNLAFIVLNLYIKAVVFIFSILFVAFAF